MLAESADSIAVLVPAAITGVLGWLGKGQYDRRRYSRRNNQADIEGHRLVNKPPSNSKPGLGPVCLEHGQSIRENEKLIVRLVTLQETGVEQAEAVKAHMGRTNVRLANIEKKLPKRVEDAETETGS